MSGKSRTGHKNRGTKLTLPVGRISRYITRRLKGYNCSSRAHIAATASVQAIVATLIDHAIEHCKDSKRKRLNPTHLLKAVHGDADLGRAFKHVTVASAGTFAPPPLPPVPSASAGKRKRAKAAKAVAA